MFKTYQEAFNATIEKLKAQKTGAFNNESRYCQYLTNDGNKCAIGVHIPDGHPLQKCEGPLNALINMNSNEMPDFLMISSETQEHMIFDFWWEIQRIHDKVMTKYYECDDLMYIMMLGYRNFAATSGYDLKFNED